MTGTEDDQDFPEDAICQPDKDMGSLDQLQRYQYVLRKICPLLDPYESAALMQIVDRTAGWKRHAAYFGVGALLEGDRLYGGISRQMHRSKLMKVLASLEARGVISRIHQRNFSEKIYRVNYEVDLDVLSQSAPAERKRRPVSNRDRWVSSGDQPLHDVRHPASSGDPALSIGDPIEGNSDNDIRKSNITRQRLRPSDPIAARSPSFSSEIRKDDQRGSLNPPARTRRPSD